MSVTSLLLSAFFIIACGCLVGYLAVIVKVRMDKKKVFDKETILKKLDEQTFTDNVIKPKEDKPKKKPEKKPSSKPVKKKAKKIAGVGKNPGKRKEPKATKNSKGEK